MYQIRHGDGLCQHPILLNYSRGCQYPVPLSGWAEVAFSPSSGKSMGFRLISQGIAPKWAYRLWTQDNWHHFTGVLWSPNQNFFQLFYAAIFWKFRGLIFPHLVNVLIKNSFTKCTWINIAFCRKNVNRTIIPCYIAEWMCMTQT